MLSLKNKILTLTGIINTADTILKLTADIDCNINGIVTLSDTSTKYISFIKENSYYKTRLTFTEEDIKHLDNVTLCLILTSATEERTNTIKLDLDINKIKQSIKLSKSKDIQDIRSDLNKLTVLVNDILSNKLVYQTNLNIDQSNILPGMIPVAINEQGLCMFKHPFIDHITEINGQKTINNAIILTAKDIPIEQTDVATAIKAHTDAIKELNNLMKTISSELKSTKNKVADIEKALLLHTDSSII